MGMEPEIKDFFIKIVNTISMVVLWMMLNAIIGIKYELAFFDNAPGWKNYVYYACSIVTLIWVVRYVLRKWNI